ncbi:MAG: MBL fold metallo-hydrolase [SAR86 cluster bacterium]|jgi:L-ascorbate metabolism protein UlaG (beta-lactamase superfamily)|nr:MBL fold metallo-hydrolase [SAR86 cluster bacterium]HIC27394.1 MBL fold metallo-hydrolase [Gammaproteobacteria bacterium]
MSGETFSNTNQTSFDSERSFGDFLKWRLTRKEPKAVQIETSDQWKQLGEQSKNYAVWIGHSTYLLNNGDLTIVTDPVFSKRASPFSWAGPKRLIAPAISLEELPDIDVITVSHNHYDHLDIASLKTLHKLNPKALFLVSKGDMDLLVRSGIKNVTEFLWWENIEVKNTMFTFTPNQHWSARGFRDRNKSLWGGWFMQSSNHTIYHAGDTGYSDDFKETRSRLGSPDFAMIPIGGYNPRWFMNYHHVNPSESIQIALDLGVSKSFGMHWGTFRLTDEDILEPAQLIDQELKKLNLADDFFRTVKPGEILPL